MTSGLVIERPTDRPYSKPRQRHQHNWVYASGRLPALGAGGRVFESLYPDSRHGYVYRVPVERMISSSSARV